MKVLDLVDDYNINTIIKDKMKHKSVDWNDFYFNYEIIKISGCAV